MIVEVIEYGRTEFWYKEVNEVVITTPNRRIGVYNLNECPEDATINRDLGFVYSIPDMLKEAYEAGKAGEDFKIIYLEGEE